MRLIEKPVFRLIFLNSGVISLISEGLCEKGNILTNMGLKLDKVEKLTACLISLF